MESQPKNPEFGNNPENFHPWQDKYRNGNKKHPFSRTKLKYQDHDFVRKSVDL